MNKFKFECYDENNNIIVNNNFNKLECLNDFDEYEEIHNYHDNILFVIDVPVSDSEKEFNNMNFIKKICYYLNKLTKYYYYEKIKKINKIIFTLDSNKFVINKIKSNKNYNIYNINYIENDKEIFNNNIFLYNFNYFYYYECNCGNINDEKFNIYIPLGDYIYELLENKEYYEKYQFNYEKMTLEKDTIIKDLKNKCNFINEITNINKNFDELKDKYNKLIDERNNFVEDEIKKYYNNLNNLLLLENERLKDENKKINDLLEINKKDNETKDKDLIELQNKYKQLEEENKNNQKKLKQIQLIIK